MNPHSLLISCQAGAPENPRTWSGTPSHLISAMTADERIQPIAWSSRLSGKVASGATIADRLLGMGHPFIWGPCHRLLASHRVLRQARNSLCSGVLHLGTYDVPLLRSAIPSYLYVDNSYDIWESRSESAQGLSPCRRRNFRRLEARVLSKVDHIFTIGEHVGQNLHEQFGVPQAKISAVGSGLGEIQPYYGDKDYSVPRMLMVAKLRPRDKGLPLVVEAIRVLRKVIPDVELTVVGGEKYPELANEPGIITTGWVTQEALQSLYEEATLFLMPATYEPWGLAYLEALACRTPVVGLYKNALPEITKDGEFGFLLDEATPQALAALIQHALSDAGRLAFMGKRGQDNTLAKYDWTRVADAMIETICKSLLQREGET
ncbi:MAG: glycosyltransferase family 4 protein [Oceanococcus sp.]